jgi:hypothetical protein
MQSRLHLAPVFMIAAAALGCSSSSSPTDEGSVSVTGSFASVPLGGLDNALAADVTTSKGGGLDIELTEGATCADLTAGNTAGAIYFDLFLTAADGSGDEVTPTAPATFQTDPSSAGPYVEASIEQLGSDCSQTTSGQFQTGTVTVTSLSGGVVSGTFDLSNGSDEATGTFTTVACAGLATAVEDSGSAACN